MFTRKPSRGIRRCLILPILLVLLSGCSAFCRWCDREADLEQGVTLLDGDGGRTDSIDLFDNLRVGVTDLDPGGRYTLRVVDGADRRQLSYARLTADRRGIIVPSTLLFAENLFPCRGIEDLVPAADEDPELRTAFEQRVSRRIEAWHSPVSKPYFVEVLDGDRLVRRARFSIRDQQEPRLYVADRHGCLRSGLRQRDDDVYVIGRNFPPGSRVQLFAVEDQGTWREGDPFEDVSGVDGTPEVETVELSHHQRHFFARIWRRGTTTTGLYDVIARWSGLERHELEARDVVTAGLDVGFVIQADATDPHIEQNMTVPANATSVLYWLFQDKYFNTEDVWVAVNPKDRPGGLGSGPQNARIYTVSHLAESAWLDGLTLTDVSSDGYEEVPIKGSCRNQNEIRIWPAPLVNGNYDVVVDFPPFGIYDQGQDIVDELDNVGFQVVDPASFALVYPINGLRVFPDKEVPTGFKRDYIYAVAKVDPGVAGTSIYWDSTDIDDPSANAAPVDPNGSTGDDNRGNYGAAPGAPDGDDGFLLGENASGVATTTTLAGGFAYVRFSVTSQPGDNFTVRASTSSGFSPFEESAPITVWRRLHVEIDSMGAPSGTTVTGNVTGVVFNSGINQSQVSVDVTLDAGGGTGGRFENGTLTAGGNPFNVLSNTSSVVTAQGNVPNGVSFILEDDDVVPADIAEPDVGDMVRAYGKAFILPVFDTGEDTDNVTFDLNSEFSELSSQINAGKGTPASTDDYWTVTAQGGFQTSVSSDNDPDDEGTWRAVAVDSVQGTLFLTESIRDWIQAPTAKDGAGGIDPDTTGDLPRSPRRQEILDHEVGHLLSLSHGDGSITAADPHGGVMRPSCCPANTRQSSNFTQQSLHKLRSIVKPD